MPWAHTVRTTLTVAIKFESPNLQLELMSSPIPPEGPAWSCPPGPGESASSLSGKNPSCDYEVSLLCGMQDFQQHGSCVSLKGTLENAKPSLFLDVR